MVTKQTGPSATYSRRLVLVAAWGALICLLPAGCGYRMETVGLPGGARNLHVAVIRNATFTAEVDVRLQRELRRLLFRDAGIRVTPREESDLTLEILVNRLYVSRGRSLQATDVTSIRYSLAGHFSLIETGSGRIVLDHQLVSTATGLDFQEARVETPAVRDEGLDDALQAFARKIVDRLLLSF